MGLISSKRDEHDKFIDQQIQQWIKQKLSNDGLIQNRLIIYLTGLIHTGHKNYVKDKIDIITDRLAKSGFKESQYLEILNLKKECD